MTELAADPKLNAGKLSAADHAEGMSYLETLPPRLVTPYILCIPSSAVVFQSGVFATPFALLLTYPPILIPFSTWLLMGYFKAIPYELEECALIDGASRWQILTRIIVPLAVPGLISAFIFCFTLCWNEFIYALTFLSSTQNKTVPVALF